MKGLRKKGYITHLCGLDLPSGAVLKHRGKYIASPELVFLELANELDFHQLILLGIQMCSHPPGEPSKAVSSKKKLEAFIKKTSRHYGYRNAMRAVKYIEDGSASIMESIVFLILTLPNLLGGFGLNGACFNNEIYLNHDAAQRLGQNRCFVDLYYSEARLAIEYDSFTHHNSAAAQGKDLSRATALERQGIDTMRLGTTMFYNKKEFDEFILNLASRLGKRIRIRTNKFEKEHNNLRSLMPRKINDNK